MSKKLENLHNITLNFQKVNKALETINQLSDNLVQVPEVTAAIDKFALAAEKFITCDDYPSKRVRFGNTAVNKAKKVMDVAIRWNKKLG